MNFKTCPLCKTNNSLDNPSHTSSRDHLFNFMLYEWDRYKEALAKDQAGLKVTVVPVISNGFHPVFSTDSKSGIHEIKTTWEFLKQHENTINFCCKIKNHGVENMIITSASILRPYPLFSLEEPGHILDNGCYPMLHPGASYTFNVQFYTANFLMGRYKIPFHVRVQHENGKSAPISFARSIVVFIDDDSIKDTQQYEMSPYSGQEWEENIELVDSTNPSLFLGEYRIPAKYHFCLKYGLQNVEGVEKNVLHEIEKKLKPDHVTEDNYKEFFHILLWVHEIAQTIGLKKYNMQNVILRVNQGLLELDVPGLGEKRPSVIVGDGVDIKIHGKHKAYRGIVQFVKEKSIVITNISSELIHVLEANPHTEMDVRFVLGRLVLERMHQGVDNVACKNLVSNLFPDISLANIIAPIMFQLRNRDFFNNTIAKNAEQKTAVEKILNNASGVAPYIVFGPPGTGKTVTIVEAILQIKKNTKKKILVCAPSNSACNMLTERLYKHCTKKELVRIISENAETTSAHPEILPYTNLDSERNFTKILATDLRNYRIVVTTLVKIGAYSRQYFPDVVFIDEAGQALEPEACSAIQFISSGKQLVLSGDPKQLGPLVSSDVTRKYGLDISLLERLMALPLYKNNNNNFITMLKMNFRSHSTILRLSNDMFYDGQLVPVSIFAHQDPLANIFVYNYINKKQSVYGKKGTMPGHPVEFHCVHAKEQRDRRSPSYYNYSEVGMVKKYVDALIGLPLAAEHRVLPSQIGVLTPYVRQVHKVRNCLKSYPQIEVGTTEAFQGREKRVIIITTVRAQEDLLLYDRKYNIGFVSNEKRFNVALTRAMSKVIVIGNALVLGTDEKWLRYIEYTEELDTYSGAPYARLTASVIDEITRQMKGLEMHSKSKQRRQRRN